MSSKSKLDRKSFSKFKLDDAYRALKLQRLLPWEIVAESLMPSQMFQTFSQRLQENFDLKRTEEGKKLIIDLLFMETIAPFPSLKIWKGGRLESDLATGEADYLITENIAYISTPMLCVVEAKKDDFEQGLAQCLMEMNACQWNNLKKLQSSSSRTIDILGIVTNGEGWQFYKLTPDNQVYETQLYTLKNLPEVLGTLNFILALCSDNLLQTQADR
jgi:hypothetical protein